jgi:N,N'-diacetyllegionaminate synthase
LNCPGYRTEIPHIKIGGRLVGRGCPPFIIAEAGINHNGELDKACAMVEVAKEAGADAVKFQTFKAEEFVGDPDLMYTYESQGKEITESMLEMFRRYEFTRDEWVSIKKKCDAEGVIFLSTPQNRSDLDLLLEIGIPAIKVGSDDFANIPLLKSYAQTELPMIISCGMADLAEVYDAFEAIGSLDGYPTIGMLCTSQYPTPPKDVNLLKLRTLANAFPMVIIGFSDHTQGPLASSLAVAMGAAVFEKHFTLDHNLPGPDHWFSEDPNGVKEWIASIKKSAEMLGSEIIRPTHQERLNKKDFQRIIVASADIKKGTLFSADNLTMRRISGGKGLPPKMIYFLWGKPANRNYKKGDPVEL